MKTLEHYINEAGLIKYDEKRHITGVDFSKLTNVGDNNILNDIESAGLGMLISPEEEEFDYQWMNVYWDKLMIEFYMPNNLTNGAPMGFNFKIKIDKAAMDRWMGGNYEWKMDDFSLYQAPGSFVKLSKNMDTTKFKTQLCTLVALVMNRQPEPLW
jgi:hypothetical protein